MIFEELFKIYDKECEKTLLENVALTSLNHFTFNHYLYLQAINEMTTPTLSEIAEYLQITKPSTTVMINKFIKEKFVIKQQSEADKRNYYIQLTDFGKKIVNLEKDVFVGVGTQLLKGLDDEETKTLEKLLRKGMLNVK